jgi:outer membrane lipoprotein-sorting protein
MRSTSRIVCLALALVFAGASACTTNESSGSESPAKPSKTSDGGSGQRDDGEPEAPKSNYPAAEELLARHVEACGGADKIAQFSSLYVESSIDTGKQKLRGTSKVWWKPGKFYLEEEVEGIGPSQMGYDGTTLWMRDPINGLRKLEGREAAGYIQASSTMFPAHDWQKFYSKAETTGSVEVDGKKVWEVVLTSKEGPDVTMGLDAETGLIRFMKTTQISPMGETPFELYSEEYREVNGYKFSFTNKASISGLIEITTVTTKLEPNAAIDETKFAYPSEHAVVPADPTAQPPVVAPPPEADDGK